MTVPAERCYTRSGDPVSSRAHMRSNAELPDGAAHPTRPECREGERQRSIPARISEFNVLGFALRHAIPCHRPDRNALEAAPEGPCPHPTSGLVIEQDLLAADQPRESEESHEEEHPDIRQGAQQVEREEIADDPVDADDHAEHQTQPDEPANDPKRTSSEARGRLDEVAGDGRLVGDRRIVDLEVRASGQIVGVLSDAVDVEHRSSVAADSGTASCTAFVPCAVTSRASTIFTGPPQDPSGIEPSTRLRRHDSRSMASQRRHETVGSLETSKRKRAAVREEAHELIGFCFGALSILGPASAILAGVLGVIAGLVTPLEAAIATGIVVLLSFLLMFDRRWPLVERVAAAIVDGSAVVVARLAPIPVLGRVAYVLACTIVVWYPIVLLAIVAWPL